MEGGKIIRMEGRKLKLVVLLYLTVLTGAEPGVQLAGFEDLFKLATEGSTGRHPMQDRADRSLANTYPFHLGDKRGSPGHTAGRRVSPSPVRNNHHAHHQTGQAEALSPAAQSSSFGSSLLHPPAAHTNYQAQAGVPASSFHLNLQAQSQAQAGFSLLAGFGSRTNPISQYQIGSSPQAPQHHYAAGQAAALQPYAQAPAVQPYAPAPAVQPYQPAPAVQHYPQAPTVSTSPQFANFPPAAPAAAYAPQSYHHENEVPNIVVTTDAVSSLARGQSQCPAAPSLTLQQCQGAGNTCWSVGVSDVDCPGNSLCCFDGCANVCYGQARAVVRPSPSFVNPERRRNPAQRRRKPAGQTLESVAAAGQRCIDKIEQVEEIEYDEVEECNHSYDKKCHTSYSTEYEAQQEEECDDNYNK